MDQFLSKRRRHSIALMKSGTIALEMVANLREQLTSLPSFSTKIKCQQGQSSVIGIISPATTCKRYEKEDRTTLLKSQYGSLCERPAGELIRREPVDLSICTNRLDMEMRQERDLATDGEMENAPFGRDSDADSDEESSYTAECAGDVRVIQMLLLQLKEMLANEFDYIEAEDTCSIASDDSHDSGRHSGDMVPQPPWPPSNTQQWTYASTPFSEAKAPPLTTPVITRRYSSPKPGLPAPTHLHPATCNQPSTVTDPEPLHYQPYKQPGHYQSNPELYKASSGAVYSPGSGTNYSSSPGERTSANNNNSDGNTLHEKFFTDGAGDARAHLEVLYQAKSRQLQELQEKHGLCQLENTKEIRLLRHELALAQGSKQGTEASLKQTHSMLTQAKEARFELQKSLDQLQQQFNHVQADNSELRSSLEAAESSIEALNAQIFALGSSETLQRQHEQHEAVVSSLRGEFNQEVDEQRQRVSEINQQLHNANEMIESLKSELSNERSLTSRQRVEHADEVNKLTKSLKESRDTAQELLLSTSSDEFNKLKVQQQQTSASKTLTEQLCQSLKDEVADLREQLSLYESSSRVGLYNSPNYRPEYDDTMMELGVKSTKPSSARPTSDTETMLTTELAKYMSTLKEKRDEVSRLRTQCDALREQLNARQTDVNVQAEQAAKLQKELQEATIELNLYKSAARDGSSLIEVRLKTDLDRSRREVAIVQDQLKETQDKLTTALENEARLADINSELNSKMSDMVEDFDTEKQAALGSCEQAWQQHTDTMRDMYAKEQEDQINLRMEQLEKQYKHQLALVEEKNAGLNEELTQVKEFYVHISQENKTLQEQLEKIKLAVQQDSSTPSNSMTCPSDLDTILSEIHSLKHYANEHRPLNQKVSSLEDQKQHLEAEKQALQEKLDSFQKKFNDQVKAVEDGKSEEKKSLTQLDSASTELTACRKLFKTDSGEFDETLAVPIAGKLEQVGAELSEIQAQVKELTDKIQSLETQLEAKTRETRELEEQLESVSKSHTSDNELMENLKDQVKMLQSDNQQKTQINSSLSEDIKRLDSMLSSERVALTVARTDLERIERQLQTERSKSQSEVTESLLKKLSEEKGRLECEVIRLRSDAAAAKASHNYTKSELEKTESALTKERKHNSINKSDVDRLNQELRLERAQLQDTSSRLRQLELALKTEQQNHNMVKLVVVKLEAQLAAERSNHDETRSVYQRLQEANGKLKSETELLRAKDGKQGDIISEINRKAEALKTELMNTKEALEKAQRELIECRTEIVKIQAQLTQSETTKTSLTERLRTLIEDHRVERESLISEHRMALEGALEEARLKWSQHKAESSSELVAENKYLKEKINSLERETRKYEELLTQADSHFEKQLEKQRQQMERDYEEEVSRLKNSDKKSNSQHQILQASIADLEKRCVEYQDVTKGLREKLEKSTNQITDLKSTNKKLHSQVKHLKSSGERKIEGLTKELSECQKFAETAALNHTTSVESLQAKLEAVQAERAGADGERLSEELGRIKAHYETALQQMTADVLRYVNETNKAAARLIRIETQKAKHTTARQLRNYYLKCFKDLSHGDCSLSVDEKNSLMERTLDNGVSVVTQANTDQPQSLLEVPHRLLDDNQLSQSLRRSRLRDGSTEGTPRSASASRISRPNSSAGGSRFKYEPLKPSNSQTVSRIIDDLGLGKTGASPPRQYNPPPERLSPSPNHQGAFRSYSSHS